ncbi:pilus assembly protein PilP [bacterium]|nr:pilus assembly protein PilP [bacterium]
MKTVMVLIILVFQTALSQDVCAQAKTPASPAPDSTVKAEGLTDFTRSAPVYDAQGKRDPFGSLAPAEVEENKKIKGLFNYEKAKLQGIVKTDDDIYALVLDADGFGHVLRVGYMVYGGYVTDITDDSVRIHVVKYGRSISVDMFLESSKSTVLVEQDEKNVIKRPGIDIVYETGSQPQKTIRIEDIVIPSLSTKTLEEKWLSTSGEFPVVEQQTESTSKENVKAFSLYDPPDDSWIRLPHVLKWSRYDGDSVTYILLVDDNPDFGPPNIIREKVRETSYILIEDMELPLNKKLYWKVIALDSSGIELPCRQSCLSFRIAGNK